MAPRTTVNGDHGIDRREGREIKLFQMARLDQRGRSHSRGVASSPCFPLGHLILISLA